MNNVSISLLVLKTAQPDKLREFYARVGIEFIEEQHGSGPVHFAGQLAGAVLEIYPLAEGETVDSTTRVGFVVANVSWVIERLWRREFCELKGPKQTPWGYRAVVRDPDGRAVELYQRIESEES